MGDQVGTTRGPQEPLAGMPMEHLGPMLTGAGWPNRAHVVEAEHLLLVASVGDARALLASMSSRHFSLLLWGSAIGIPQSSGQVDSALDGAVVLKLCCWDLLGVAVRCDVAGVVGLS